MHVRSLATNVSRIASGMANEGVFAIAKPTAISSAQVIRDVQRHFNPSQLFLPWIQAEQARLDAESHNQKRKRKGWRGKQPVQVKMGHGGTLDPMATGVLILGVGKGTKSLNSFLTCTKSYETVVLFGAATDSYDTEGKVVARKPFAHITKEKVEEALGRFRGKIMQRPPIFSALRIQGKRLYEYAREGKELPAEIQERPVEVIDLELLEWMEGGTHQWDWPVTEAQKEEKEIVDKVLHLGHQPDSSVPAVADSSKSTPNDTVEALATTSRPTEDTQNDQSNAQKKPSCPAPACRLRMTVTSGFYVRSLCHDLGAAVDSLGIMTSLVRTRQGDFTLGTNVLPYEDLEKGEEVWSPQVERFLEAWNSKPAVNQVPKPENGRASPPRHTPPRKKARRNSSSDEDA